MVTNDKKKGNLSEGTDYEGLVTERDIDAEFGLFADAEERRLGEEARSTAESGSMRDSRAQVAEGRLPGSAGRGEGFGAE